MNDFQCECPFCGGLAECETVHNGVGLQQAQPYICGDCVSTQMNPWQPENGTKEENECGWYKHPDLTDEILAKIKQDRIDTENEIIKRKFYENSRLMKVM
jgi:hypothetical protein